MFQWSNTGPSWPSCFKFIVFIKTVPLLESVDPSQAVASLHSDLDLHYQQKVCDRL